MFIYFKVEIFENFNKFFKLNKKTKGFRELDNYEHISNVKNINI